MSRNTFIVAALALLAPVAVAQAQINFGIAAGASVPSGNFANSVETGYHLMATAGLQPPLAPIGLRVDGMFNEFNAKAPATSKLRVMGVTANAVLSMPGAIVLSPYVIGGVGMYNTRSTAPNVPSNGDFGFNVGAGIKFGLAGFSAFGEARWHSVKSNNTTTSADDSFRFIPITFGIIF
jgi:hypothetical protein